MNVDRVLQYWARRLPERYRDDALQEARIAQWRCEVAGKPGRYVTLRTRGALLDYISHEKAVKRGGSAGHLPYDDEQHGLSTPEPTADCLGVLESALSERDWALLRDRWLLERTARETAAEWRINPGLASRLTDRALQRARQVLEWGSLREDDSRPA